LNLIQCFFRPKQQSPTPQPGGFEGFVPVHALLMSPSGSSTPDRDPEERVREDDLVRRPPDAGLRFLYAHETAGVRRRCYVNLLTDGEL
jgi:hypothetical protein